MYAQAQRDTLKLEKKEKKLEAKRAKLKLSKYGIFKKKTFIFKQSGPFRQVIFFLLFNSIKTQVGILCLEGLFSRKKLAFSSHVSLLMILIAKKGLRSDNNFRTF